MFGKWKSDPGIGLTLSRGSAVAQAWHCLEGQPLPKPAMFRRHPSMHSYVISWTNRQTDTHTHTHTREITIFSLPLRSVHVKSDYTAETSSTWFYMLQQEYSYKDNDHNCCCCRIQHNKYYHYNDRENQVHTLHAAHMNILLLTMPSVILSYGRRSMYLRSRSCLLNDVKGSSFWSYCDE